MMKKIISILLLTMSFAAYSDLMEDHSIWIWNLQAQVAALQVKTNALQTEINSVPAGKQGIPGPKGERGARGLPGTYTAGVGIAIDGDVIKSTQSTHQIGEEYRGGLVFYVDESGLHGLIASKIDVDEVGVQWRNGASGNKVTNARGDGIGSGETNTRLIISQQTIDDQKGKFAALLADNFQIMEDGLTPCKTPVVVGHLCYGGWYLPSAFELQLLHKNLHQNNLSSFAPEFYWSSTEASVSTAWLINFSTGEITASSKSNTVGRVRAITHF